MPSKFVVLCEGSKCRVYKVRKDVQGNQFVMKKKGDSMVRFCIKKTHPTFSSRPAAMKVQKSLLKNPKACRAKSKSQKKSVKRVPKSKVESMKKKGKKAVSKAKKTGSKSLAKARKSMKNMDRRKMEQLGMSAAALAAVSALGWSMKDMMTLSKIPSMPDFQAKEKATSLMETALTKLGGMSVDRNTVRTYASMMGNSLVQIMKMPKAQADKMLDMTKKTVGDMVVPTIPRPSVNKLFAGLKKLTTRAREMKDTVGMMSSLMPSRSTDSGPDYSPLPRVSETVERLETPMIEETIDVEAPKKWFWQSKYGNRRRRKPAHYRRMGRFGRSPTLSQSTGFVRPPFNISMAESYTGMRPRSYLRHAMSPTASPVMMPPGTGVAAANSYYGSYGMGLHLNPQARQPAAKFGKKKRKSVRKAPKRKRKSVRKSVPKSLKNQAKRHGIRLTVKRGDKRVPKSEKELRRQLRNKMKAKKAPKKSMPKSKRKVKRRKAPKRKRRVKRKTAKFGRRNQFFF